MMSLSLRYTIVTKYQSCEDIRNEMKNICNLRVKHEMICRSLEKWRRTLEQSNTQLDILNNTASSLRKRHKVLTDALALQTKNDSASFKRFRHEISTIEAQVYVWMRELSEIKYNRQRLDFDHAFENLRLRTNLQRSMTNIELAHIDFDFLQNSHCDLWKNFLHENLRKNEDEDSRFESDNRMNDYLNLDSKKSDTPSPNSKTGLPTDKQE